MKRMETVGSFLRDLVGERDRQGGASTEADDVDFLIAGLEVVLQTLHHLADALVTAEAERLGDLVTGEGAGGLADPLQIQAAPLLLRIVIRQGIFVGPEEIEDV